jgi:hypothetical protein
MNLILVELNEINFDIVKTYIENGINLPGFNSVIGKQLINTIAEDKYDEIEPWIQWPSVHTGLNYDCHKVFRLGDFVNSDKKQFFEKVEDAGYIVGAISPMNASNKLKNPAFFIPDPWTQTPSDGSFLSKRLTSALSQAVNDNSQSRLTISTIINLSAAFLALVNPIRFIPMIWYAMTSFKRPWRKALFLDMFLFEIHKTLCRRKKPNFSTIFLNAGAHIQHHYYYNSPYVKTPELKNPSWYVAELEDPFLEMIRVYDHIIQNLLSLSNTEIIIATGLSQKPYDKLTYYYRLVEHESFLNEIGVSFSSVVPRMTRDFLINFNNPKEALSAEKKLNKIMVDNNVKFFKEIDNRGNSLFVVLTFSDEITEKTRISLGGWSAFLKKYVVFVAIKNGEHQSKGFAYFSEGVLKFAPATGSRVSKVHNSVLNFFDISN